MNESKSIKIIYKVKISLEEAKSWIFYEHDVKDYYNYFPIYISIPGHEIRVYYININTKSDKCHWISCLRLIGGTVPEIDLNREE